MIPYWPEIDRSKRYLCFAGMHADNEPAMGQLFGTFDSPEEAIAALELEPEGWREWHRIVDRTTLETLW